MVLVTDAIFLCSRKKNIKISVGGRKQWRQLRKTYLCRCLSIQYVAPIFFLLPKTIFFSKYFPYNPTLGRSTRDLSENTNIIAEKCHYRRRHSLKVLRGKNV